MNEAESSAKTTSLEEYLRVQQDLVREASLALPHSFSQCSYSLGYLRQPVYLCQTCPEARGLCASCSIACHADHEQIELFPKRHFRCDCPTTGIAHPCTLHKRPELENTENQYGQNFQGLFCRCHRTYDAATEREAMIQCLACEDWFHESCCNLRERPPPRGSTPPPEDTAESSRSTPPTPNLSHAPAPTDPAYVPSADITPPDPTDALSDTSSSASDLPPALLAPEDYEAFVCGACVLRIAALRRAAGSGEAVMVGRKVVGGEGKGEGDVWVRIGEEGVHGVKIGGRGGDGEGRADGENGDGEEGEVDITGNAGGAAGLQHIVDDAIAGSKRHPEEALYGHSAKRQRLSEQSEGAQGLGTNAESAKSFPITTNGPCRALARGPAGAAGQASKAAGQASTMAGRILDAVSRGDYSLGTGDVFLTREDFRERWCRCEECLPSLLENKFLLEDEETWEPPEDEDSGRSLEELGLRALNKIPRDRAIDGITHYNALRDHLVSYLRPFAREGKVVGETDVRSFFAELAEARAKPGL